MNCIFSVYCYIFCHAVTDTTEVAMYVICSQRRYIFFFLFFFFYFLISICNTRGEKKKIFRGTFATKMLFLTLRVLLLLLGFKKEILSRTPVA